MSEKRLETIIVLRNGTKEAWEADDSYILLAGEVGVGYMDVMAEDGSTVAKTVPIIKVGDGKTAWKALPQAEGVFENDVTYPRVLPLYVGDSFTTNNYTGTEEGAVAAKVVNGVLTLQAAADADTLFVAKLATLPAGQKAYHFVYVGKVVAETADEGTGA